MSNYNGKTFGEILMQKREEYGWTQSELANKVNSNQRVVSTWECGRNQPRLDTLILLADLFECTIDELVGRTL